jgi:hypothetical protein
MYDNYVGIDIAAATFTAAWQTANEWYDTPLTNGVATMHDWSTACNKWHHPTRPWSCWK